MANTRIPDHARVAAVLTDLLERVAGRWTLDQLFDQWRKSPDGETGSVRGATPSVEGGDE